MINIPHEKERIDYVTGEVKVVNNNFVQFYKDGLDLLIESGNINKSAITVFLWICRRMDMRNALVASQKAIAESIGVSTRTVQSATAYLKEVKVLEILKSGNTNVYLINSNVVWQDDADNKKFAHFTAAVYLTGSEQENDYKKQSFAHVIKKSPKRVRKPQEKAINDFEKE